MQVENASTPVRRVQILNIILYHLKNAKELLPIAFCFCSIYSYR